MVRVYLKNALFMLGGLILFNILAMAYHGMLNWGVLTDRIPHMFLSLVIGALVLTIFAGRTKSLHDENEGGKGKSVFVSSMLDVQEQIEIQEKQFLQNPCKIKKIMRPEIRNPKSCLALELLLKNLIPLQDSSCPLEPLLTGVMISSPSKSLTIPFRLAKLATCFPGTRKIP